MVSVQRTYRVVDRCTRGGVPEVKSQETCTSPRQCLIDLRYCQNVPSFLIDTGIDEVSQTGILNMTVLALFWHCLALVEPPIQANS